jgi:lipid II:glycine glycyltransferase (peptidoglycan interpeptide bridge formation enzyme)
MLSSNWARNLHRGEAKNSKPYEWTNFTPEAIANIYGQLTRYKDLDSVSDTPSFEVIRSIIDKCVSNLKIFRCDNEHGEPLAIRGAILLGNKAWDIFAAATPQGRKQYSSHVTTWALLNYCASEHCTTYDLSGIDPVNNKGVYDFKRGTGATEVKYIGEWETGSPFYVQPIVGRLLRYRKTF